MQFSQNELKSLAKSSPKELIKILNSSNDISVLSFGAEILADEVSDEELVSPVLRKLLKHINAVVREGALIGVQTFYIEKTIPNDILDILRTMKKSDPSPVIRDYSKDILENKY